MNASLDTVSWSTVSPMIHSFAYRRKFSTSLRPSRVCLFIILYIIKDKLPEIFNHYFIFNNEIHHYNTRSASSIHLPRVDTSYGQKSVGYAGVNLWNNLPEDLKNITSFFKFKAHLKLHLQIKSYADWLCIGSSTFIGFIIFHFICISVLVWLWLVLLCITVFCIIF